MMFVHHMGNSNTILYQGSSIIITVAIIFPSHVLAHIKILHVHFSKYYFCALVPNWILSPKSIFKRLHNINNISKSEVCHETFKSNYVITYFDT